ncbi:Zinc finger MYM-type-like protein [Daphnia magna]|uniref:Zinc finger MYM-type-like protein n=1 Tax=Daphnia magna TaxID=35525 RepID=A0A164YJ81_9CRUS|nr:Zinc finger MYM-type-like protein [Daphnia magna]
MNQRCLENKIFYEIADAVLVGLNSRFKETETSKPLTKVEVFIIGKSDVSHVKEFFRDDFEDYGRLTLHRNIFLDLAKAKNVTLVDFQSSLDFLKSVNEDISQSLTSIIPEFVKLMKIVLTMPVSTCTAERSFSCLCRLKTYLHSTMTQERLNHLAVLCCHSDLLENIDLDSLNCISPHPTTPPLPRRKDNSTSMALQPYKIVQYVKETPSLDQAEDPRPERTDDAFMEIELDIEIADEESDDDEELLSDNESDDGNGHEEENCDPQAEKEMMFMILNKNISVKHFQKG